MFRLMRLLFAITLLIASNTPSGALAQTVDDPWAVPLNLSHSGVAINPAIVIDSEAGIHAVWQDDLSNFVYTRLHDDQWSAPETTELNRLFGMPTADESSDQSQLALYSGPNPLFIAGPGPYIFAFWISPEGKLFTSKVINQNFKYVSAWDPGGVVASEVASFAVTVDAHGDWHLAYFHTLEDPRYPAGIYYTHSRNSGWNWAIPVLVNESPYLRRIGEGEANLSIAIAGTEEPQRVFIAWDNRPRKQVLLAQSADSGKSWEPPALIEGPAPASGLSGPFNIQVAAQKDSVVLVWQSGRPDGTCTQLYQTSSNAGAIWSEPQPMLGELSECPHSNKFISNLANNPSPRVPPRLYLLTETQSQIYLTAWNGLQWSETQEQQILSGFEDPEVYTDVDYGCHQGSVLEERLYMVGCDQGLGGDVWVTSRDLASARFWFSSSVWSPPSPVSDENLEIESIELVATDDDLIHAFFNQAHSPVIYYTYWDGELWSSITTVLKLPDGEAGWPTVITGPENELLLFVPNNSGGLYFSRAISGNAMTETLWSTPARLGLGHDGQIGSVDVAWDNAGTIYLAYSISVNEKRGIYLVYSRDQGTTWSEPIQVFDGAAAGFDLVGAPSLLVTENGSLHILWKEQSIRGDGALQPLSLYYARSEDGGITFGDAELVVEEPVAWREMLTDGKGNLHLLWQPQDMDTTVWDQVSLDGGHTWQYPQGLPDEGRLVEAIRDAVGRLHFVSIGQGALGHWLWDNSRWQSESPLGWTLSSEQEGPVEALAAAVSKQGKMVVVLAAPSGQDADAQMTLLYSTRTLELSQEQAGNQDIPTETISPSVITTVTSTPKPLLTPTASVNNQSVDQGQMDRAPSNNPISLFTMALLPVALLLLSVLGIVMRRAARDKDR
jgi:hypothetical protein